MPFVTDDSGKGNIHQVLDCRGSLSASSVKWLISGCLLCLLMYSNVFTYRGRRYTNLCTFSWIRLLDSHMKVLVKNSSDFHWVSILQSNPGITTTHSWPQSWQSQVLLNKCYFSGLDHAASPLTRKAVSFGVKLSPVLLAPAVSVLLHPTNAWHPY